MPAGGAPTTANVVACASCGASLRIPGSANSASCEYCGTSLTIERSAGHVYSQIQGDLNEIKSGVDALRRDSGRQVALATRGAHASEHAAAEVTLQRLRSEIQQIKSRLGVVAGTVTAVLKAGAVAAEDYQEGIDRAYRAHVRGRSRTRKTLAAVGFGIALTFLLGQVATPFFFLSVFLAVPALLLWRRQAAASSRISKLGELSTSFQGGAIPKEVRERFKGDSQELAAVLATAKDLETQIASLEESLGHTKAPVQVKVRDTSGRVVEVRGPEVPENLLPGSTVYVLSDGEKPGMLARLDSRGVVALVLVGLFALAMIARQVTEDDYLAHREAAEKALAAGDWDAAQREAQAAIDTGYEDPQDARGILARAQAEKSFLKGKAEIAAKRWHSAYSILRPLRTGLLRRRTEIERLLKEAAPHVRKELLASAIKLRREGDLEGALANAYQAKGIKSGEDVEVLIQEVSYTLGKQSFESGEFARALERLAHLGDYRDAPQLVVQIKEAAARRTEEQRRKAEAARKAKAEAAAKATREKQERELLQQGSVKAIRAAKTLIHNGLRDPASARWIKETVLDSKHPTYLVHILVDARNAMGGQVRGSYLAVVTLTGGDQFNYKPGVGLQQASRQPTALETQTMKLVNGWDDSAKEPKEDPKPEPTKQPDPVQTPPKPRLQVEVDDYTGLFKPVIQVSDVTYESPTLKFKLLLRKVGDLSAVERAQMDGDSRYLWKISSRAVVTRQVEFFDSAGKSLSRLGNVASRGPVLKIGSARELKVSFADPSQAPATVAVAKVKITINVEPR